MDPVGGRPRTAREQRGHGDGKRDPEHGGGRRATRRRRRRGGESRERKGGPSAAEPVEQQQPVRVPEEGGAVEDPLERHRRDERHDGERCNRTREPPSRGAAREPDGERDEQERLGIDGVALLDPDRLPRGGRRSEGDEPDDAGRRDGEVGRQRSSWLRARTSIPRCREQQRERERGRDTRGEHQRAGVRGRETEDVAGVVRRRGVALVDAERRHQRATARDPQPQPEPREHGETAERRAATRGRFAARRARRATTAVARIGSSSSPWKRAREASTIEPIASAWAPGVGDSSARAIASAASTKSGSATVSSISVPVSASVGSSSVSPAARSAQRPPQSRRARSQTGTAVRHMQTEPTTFASA